MLKPVKLNLQLPPSKSLTHRALLANYLAGGGKIINPLWCEDTLYLKKALEKKKKKYYFGNAGTALRLFLPFAPEGSIVTGNKYMRKRPVKDLLDTLEQLGIKTLSNKGCPPVKVLKKEIKKKEVTINASKSSQYLSALLFLAPTLPQGLTIKVQGKIASRPYVDLTLDVLKKIGIKVENKKYKVFKIKNQKYKKTNFTVDADASSATYWMAYNEISNSKIKISKENIKFKDVLNKRVIDMNEMPDEVITRAVVGIFNKGITKITNVGNLRIKECDRLKALHHNLNKLNIKNKITKDSITIWGTNGKFKKAKIKTFDDHRIAMAFGILGLEVDNPQCAKKSYPDFWKDYQKVREANVVLTGMRGTGKTTLGRKLAREWGMKFIDSDQEIEKMARKKIDQIVKEKGWKYFRNLEHKIIKKYSHTKNTLIATGGGTLMCKRNYDLLKNNYIILLSTDLKTIARRIKENKNRPPLKSEDFIFELKQVWQERKNKYYRIADKIIKT